MNTQTQGSATESPIKVMVVDDALVIRGLITRFLEAEGDMEIVASVGDGERALQALDRHPVDVVVLDIEMPRMDGLTALPKIIEKVPGVQVLMASTLTRRNAEVSLKALSLGAADYVPKPSTNSEIGGKEDFKREIIQKVRVLGRAGQRRRLARERSGQVLPTSERGTSAFARQQKLTNVNAFKAASEAVGRTGSGLPRPSQTSTPTSRSSFADLKKRADSGTSAGAKPFSSRPATTQAPASPERTTRPTSPIRASDKPKSLYANKIELRPAKRMRPDVIAIGSSTGGP
ncbi:MAG: response regulator, partial [Alphaproteobacteria bacterium]|nr:response regulator [Alphaproteobacteria bacterium]